MLDKLEVGVITSPHGLKGEVNVYPTTDDVRRYDDLDRVILADEEDDDDPGREVTVEYVKYFKGRPIVKFTGLDRIEDVEAFRGAGRFVPRSEAVPLGENEYFIGDLLGSEVCLEDGTPFGKLADILRTGANDVYAVELPGGEIRYLAAVREVVRAVDPAARRITVRPMKEI